MKWSGNADQVLRKIGEDAPVVSFIGVRQGRAGNPTTESHVVEFAAHRSQARLDVAETLAVSELSEGHRQILVPARQTSVVVIAVIAGHTLLELDVGEMSDQLRENGSAGIHPPLFRRCGVQPFRTLRLFSLQIVFGPNTSYSMHGEGLIGLRKVLYRTLVILFLRASAKRVNAWERSAKPLGLSSSTIRCAYLVPGMRCNPTCTWEYLRPRRS